MTIVEDRSARSRSLMRFLMGFLLALSLFMIELGISQVLLVRDTRCKEVVQTGRLLQDPEAECLSEGIYYFLTALSRGLFASVHSQVPSVAAWILTGIIYGILGGILFTFIQRLAMAFYLGIHALALVILTFIAYFSNYIA